jgi:hypothetical protein
MNCDDWNEILALGNEASADMKNSADEHAAACDACRDVARGFEEMKRELRDGMGDEDPPEVRDAILRVAAEETARREKRARQLAGRSRNVHRLILAASFTGTTAGSFLLGQLSGAALPTDPIALRLRLAEAELAAGEFEKAHADAAQVLSAPQATLGDREWATSILDRPKKK